MKDLEKTIKRRIAAAENMAVRYRNYRRSRERALTRLAQAHREEYYEYLAEEKAKDEQEGKRWHNITGTSLPPNLDNSTDQSSKTGRDTTDIPQDEGDNV